MPAAVTTAPPGAIEQAAPADDVAGAPSLSPLLRYAYYAFVASIPFESVDWGAASDVLSISKLFGWAFFAISLLQAGQVWRRPPPVFWSFALYLLVFAVLGLLESGERAEEFLWRLAQQLQMLALFWASFSVWRDAKAARGTFLVLGLACTAVAFLVRLGVGSREAMWGGLARTSFQDANPNTFGLVLGVGLVALLAPHFSQQTLRFRGLYTVYTLLGGLLLSLTMAGTGSRGSTFAFAVGFAALGVFAASRGKRLAGVGVALVFASFTAYSFVTTDTMRERVEHTLETGDTSGREEILSEAFDMILEKPIFGWGPENHVAELGRRTAARRRDSHNTYVWVLLETGVAGGLWFLLGLGQCVMAAWRSRLGRYGSVPLGLVTLLCVAALSGTNHNHKLFWIAMALAVAGERLQVLAAQRCEPAQSSSQARPLLSGAPQQPAGAARGEVS